ncbi:hypothetical protein HDU79_010774 [Rhizoclosmatium sp. JEL0117]|nr:hypothetical protein HDU79_010774 [Rhizoclosmatium sp. JEL0117]
MQPNSPQESNCPTPELSSSASWSYRLPTPPASLVPQVSLMTPSVSSPVSLPPLSQVLSNLQNTPFTLPPRPVYMIPSPRASPPCITLTNSPPVCINPPIRYQVPVPCQVSEVDDSPEKFKLTMYQLNMLKEIYAKNETPSVALYDRISERLGVPRKFLLTWFRHRRAKERRDIAKSK